MQVVKCIITMFTCVFRTGCAKWHNFVLNFKAIYDMLGACSSNRPADSAEERAKNIFAKMDENNDGQLTQDEFLKGCLQDEELSKMLAP